MQHGYSTLLFLLAIVPAVGCKSDSQRPNATQDGLVLSPSAVVLSGTDLGAISSVSSDQSSVVFQEAGAPNLAVGSVLVSGSSAMAPAGILRRVTSISRANGQMTVSTVPARVTDALQSGTLSASVLLTPSAGARFQAHLPGVSYSVSRLNGDFYVNLNNVVLYDADGNLNTTIDQIVANGSITLHPALQFHLDVSLFSVDSLYFAYVQSSDVSISVGIAVTRSATLSVEVGRWFLPPIPIGGPFVLTPVIVVSAGLTGSASAGVQVGASLSTSVTAGIACSHGSCTTVSDKSSSFALQPVTFNVGGTLEAYVKASLDVSLNATLGANFGAKAYLEADVSPLSSPWWSVYGGIKAGAGVSAVLGLLEIGYSDFVTTRSLIASAPSPRPTVTGVRPTSGPLAGGTNVTLTGTDFVAGATATVGGAALTNVVVVSGTSITGTTPAGTTGAKDVVVTTSGGSGTCTGCFTYGYALSFNGSSAYVTVPSAAVFSVSNITVEAWIKLSADVGPTQARIVNRQATLGGIESWGLEIFGKGGGLGSTGNQLVFHSGNCTLAPAVISTTSLQVGRWYHVAGSNDGTTLRLYVDSQLVASIPSSGPTCTTNNAPVTIGRTGPSAQFYFPGEIDEVRIWDSALSLTQIVANMRVSLSGTTPGLVGYWQFNEGQGTTTADATGRGNNGTLVSGPVWVTQDW